MSGGQRGVAAFEFVLSLPVLILGLFVVLYYGYAFVLYRIGLDAAYIGAQAAATQSPLAGTPGNAAQAAATRALAGYAEQNTKGDAQDERRCMTPAATAVAVGDGEYRYRVAIDFQACRVLDALSVELPFIGRLPPAPGPLSVTANVRL
ncbi:hypothetical protein S4A8_18041 [Salinisphaera sp. S4-8]|uniref:TadE family protein n=1 Tax=Salinisphaera sp. S4-8 TaxID=633357 RepID=UPI00333FF6A0